MDRIITTNPFVSLIAMQVCAEKDVTDDEILEHCNRDNPSGTTNGWMRTIRSGDGSPVVCADDPERLHILVVC